jgi:hypothetical protein
MHNYKHNHCPIIYQGNTVRVWLFIDATFLCWHLCDSLDFFLLMARWLLQSMSQMLRHYTPCQEQTMSISLCTFFFLIRKSIIPNFPSESSSASHW